MASQSIVLELELPTLVFNVGKINMEVWWSRGLFVPLSDSIFFLIFLKKICFYFFFLSELLWTPSECAVHFSMDALDSLGPAGLFYFTARPLLASFC